MYFVHVSIGIVPGIKEKKNVDVQLLFYEGYEVKLVYALIIIIIQLLCHQFHTLWDKPFI